MRLAAATLVLFVLLAPAALAHDAGEGLLGETDDKIVTNAGFLLIIFFPLFIFVMSMLMWRLEKRKERRKAAVGTLAGEWRGGW